MNTPVTITLLISFTLVILILISRQQHILSTLLCLEALIIFIVAYTLITLNSQSILINSTMIIILTISVSGASIGISLIIVASRNQGNDCSSSHLLSSLY